MRLLSTLIVLSMMGCTIKVEPLPKKPAVKHTHKRHIQRKSSKSHPGGIVVDHQWVLEYKDLERQHGDYTIPKDAKIEFVDGAKAIIPIEVLHHYEDMVKAEEP